MHPVHVTSLSQGGGCMVEFFIIVGWTRQICSGKFGVETVDSSKINHFIFFLFIYFILLQFG